MGRRVLLAIRKVTQMYYFALLLGPESTAAPDPDAAAAEMAAYQAFHARRRRRFAAATHSPHRRPVCGSPGGPDAPTVTDGPFAEGAEVAGGYYVFVPRTLTRRWHWPATSPPQNTARSRSGPRPSTSRRANPWATVGSHCCWSLPGSAPAPGTPEWDAGTWKHQKFGEAAG